MEREVRDRWVEALRSGRYRQGHGVLRGEENDYCCLGVLCDLMKNGMKWSDEPSEERYTFDGTSTGFPPGRLLEGVGLDSDTHYPHPLGQRAGYERPEMNAMSVLVTLNDSGTKSFDDIATWIEGNL